MAAAAAPLTLTTNYPSITVSPGTKVSFDLDVSTSEAARVELSLSGVPSKWTASLHGGGFIVGAAQTNGKDATTVRLDVDVPDDATGTNRITVSASGNGATVSLPLDIKVEAQAGGDVTVQSDYQELKGDSSSSFTFTLTVDNQTDQDLTYTSSAPEPPTGWTVDAKPAGATQAVSGTVKAASTNTVTVTVKPATNAAADTYPIAINTTVGSKTIETDVKVTITGSYKLTMSTPNDVLSTQGGAGSGTQMTFTLTNDGTSPITKINMTSSLPSNWKADFDKKTIDSLAPGDTVNVIATITPAGDAISGDYSLTFTATGAETGASDNTQIRFTVQAGILGAVIGAVLIIGVIAGLYWVFRRYGRR